MTTGYDSSQPDKKCVCQSSSIFLDFKSMTNSLTGIKVLLISPLGPSIVKK